MGLEISMVRCDIYYEMAGIAQTALQMQKATLQKTVIKVTKFAARNP
jgi:hypothetical protein